jgi:hypothetical protein
VTRRADIAIILAAVGGALIASAVWYVLVQLTDDPDVNRLS